MTVASRSRKTTATRAATSEPAAKQPAAARRAVGKPPGSDGTGKAAARGSGKGSSEYLLRLYVAGQTPKSLQAFATLKQICESHLAGRYQIEVVDLLKNPALARGDQILALPTVVRQLPPPVKKLIGDFSDTERVLVGLDLRPMKLGGAA